MSVKLLKLNETHNSRKKRHCTYALSHHLCFQRFFTASPVYASSGSGGLCGLWAGPALSNSLYRVLLGVPLEMLSSTCLKLAIHITHRRLSLASCGHRLWHLSGLLSVYVDLLLDGPLWSLARLQRGYGEKKVPTSILRRLVTPFALLVFVDV
ncbi:hypothetical protein R1flu_010079 [Riccia fluitans]|uniref:Uncharacterized protein n=1 Tax=Riccia fluitans TaxID=41844 RepID=A0ABD1Z3Y9_9MARC